MSIRTVKHALVALSGLVSGFACNTALAVAERSTINLPRGVTEVSRGVYDLHMLIFWICVVIGVVVFGVMFWSILRHRKGLREPAKFHHNTAIEVVWTIIPFVILIGMAIPAAKKLIIMEDTADADVTVLVTGYQWRWHYEYIDEGFGFYSNLSQEANEARQLRSGIDVTQIDNYLLDVDNPLVVPVGTKIRFLFTAADVIHAWWVPDFAVKKDTIPGFINEAWTLIDEPGTYRGQCAELCGRDHAFMPVVVVAKTQEDYQEWLDGQREEAEAEAAAVAEERDWEFDELMERGRGVYMSQCAACHQADGTGVAAAGFPPLNVGMSADPDRLAEHISMVVDGSPDNPAMPAFRRTLNDLELAAVITYERNAWGNDTGDVVQPSDIRELREQ